MVTLACVAPDVDGLGIIPELLTRNWSHPLRWFTLYHHSLHTLLFSLILALVAFGLATQKWKCSFLALVSFHVHLMEDLLGSRGPDGYQWPIPYFWPFSARMQWVWHGQWELNAWQNYAVTIALLFITLYLARANGYSPLEMLSLKADAQFVATIRTRFPATGSATEQRGRKD